jgi:hypothetical protein
MPFGSWPVQFKASIRAPLEHGWKVSVDVWVEVKNTGPSDVELDLPVRGSEG